MSEIDSDILAAFAMTTKNVFTTYRRTDNAMGEKYESINSHCLSCLLCEAALKMGNQDLKIIPWIVLLESCIAIAFPALLVMPFIITSREPKRLHR